MAKWTRHLDPTRWQLPDGLCGRVEARSPCLQKLCQEAEYHWRDPCPVSRLLRQGILVPMEMTAGTHLVNYHQSLQVYLPDLCSSWQPFPSASAPKRKPTEPPEETPVDSEPLDMPAPSTSSCVHESIHHVQCEIMLTRLSLPHPDDEILSGYEEDVSSIQDGYTAWVMTHPELYWNVTLSVKAVLCPSIVTPMTGGAVHPIQSIASTKVCPTLP